MHDTREEQQRDVFIALFLEKIILGLLLFWKSAAWEKIVITTRCAELLVSAFYKKTSNLTVQVKEIKAVNIIG